MPHVLIVDDDPQVLSAVAMGLARRAQVCAVSSVREAEAALRESRFDLILCDIMMPERTGIDLLDSLVESEPEMVMNFAFMSGGGVSATLQERLQESGVPLLLKPFGLKELREFVGSAVRDRDASSV